MQNLANVFHKDFIAVTQFEFQNCQVIDGNYVSYYSMSCTECD